MPRLLMVGVWVALVACGDDSGPSPASDAGMDAAPPAMVDAGPAPMCGVARCGSPLVGAHCCTSARDVTAGVADNEARCGTDLGDLVSGASGLCVELRRAGDLDAECPPQRRGAVLEPGCCTRNGVCGAANTAADLGCQTVLSSSTLPLACGATSVTDAGALDAD